MTIFNRLVKKLSSTVYFMTLAQLLLVIILIGNKTATLVVEIPRILSPFLITDWLTNWDTKLRNKE